VKCAVLAGNTAGLRPVLSNRLSRRELRISLTESHSFLNLYADTTMASPQGTQPSKMNQRSMIYSFSNTTSYSTFYAFFSSFRITLWPMWLANRKRQPCFYPPSHTHKKKHRTDKNSWQTRWETCAAPQNIQFSFSCSFLTVKLHSLT